MAASATAVAPSTAVELLRVIDMSAYLAAPNVQAQLSLTRDDLIAVAMAKCKAQAQEMGEGQMERDMTWNMLDMPIKLLLLACMVMQNGAYPASGGAA